MTVVFFIPFFEKGPAMADPYLPTRESDLITWVMNFDAKISATPAAFGVTVGQATALSALTVAFTTSYTVANDPTTNSSSNIALKNTAKENLIEGSGGIRQLVKIIQAYPPLTRAQRIELGISVPDAEPTPVPVPANPPVLTVRSTLGRTVTLQLRDLLDTEKRGKPEGVAGATILMFVGDDAPLDPTEWIFCSNTTKTTVEIDFPPNLTPGERVWFTAFWKNRREEAGPAAVAVSTRLGDNMAMAA